jgi:hypothetical protein
MGVAKSAGAHHQKREETGGKAGKWSWRDLPIFGAGGYGQAEGAGAENVTNTVGSAAGIGGGIAGKALEKKYPTNTTGYQESGSDPYGMAAYKEEMGYAPDRYVSTEEFRNWRAKKG